MPSREDLRHGPPGAADHQRKWEKQNKPIILHWKRSQLLLHPDSPERDLCNVERFRPSNGQTRNLYPDGQIPGQFALSAQAKENFPAALEGDWRQKETQEAFAKRMAEQGILVRFTTTSRAKAKPDGGKVYACKDEACQGMIFSGGWAKARFTRHQAQHEKGTVAAAAS